MCLMTQETLDMVRLRRKQISNEIADLKKEDEDLQVTERTLVRLAASMPQSSEPGAAAPTSQKDMVVSTLRTSAEPWFESSTALHDAVRKIHGVDIKKGSFLPYLSDLKAKGVIARDDTGRIALASRAG